MKPVKNLEPIAKWILRLSASAFVICLYFNYLKTLDFKNPYYLLDFAYCLFFLLLVIGGFQKGNALTIISGIFISLISIYKIYWVFCGNFWDKDLYSFVILLGVGLFFTSKGNS